MLAWYQKLYKLNLRFMKLFRICLLLFTVHFGQAQITTVKLDKASIPAGVKYTGKIIEAVKYTDADGEHIVLTTETGITDSKGKDSDGLRQAALYAYSYLIKDGKPALSWQVRDFSVDCPVDVLAEYVPGTFAVTDLNKNNKAEVWLMYRIACRGDVSPASMKIIMYEGGKKYALRGEAKVLLPTETIGGKYVMDNAFLAGNKVFKDHAVQLWLMNMVERAN